MRDVADLRDLRQPVNQVRHLVAEVFADGFKINERVFDHVVKQARGDGDFIEPHVCQDVGDFKRVDKIGLARGARLPFVLARRKK